MAAVVCFSVLLSLSASPATDDRRSPEAVAVGIDIEVAAADIHLLVNDVPVFDPAESFGGEEQIATQLRLNTAFHKGRNTVTVRIRLLPEGRLGYTPKVRIDFGYWRVVSQPFVFDGRPMAASMTITAKKGKQVLQARDDDQPLMKATRPSPVVASETKGAGWRSYTFDVDLDLDLPSTAWTQGQTLVDGPELRAELLAAVERVHTAMGEGPEAAFSVLEPYLRRRAGAVGATAREMFDYSLRSTFDGSDGFSLVPLSVTGAQMRFFGEGRLVSFVPSPHRFQKNGEETFRAFPMYYWKSKDGQWRLMH